MTPRLRTAPLLIALALLATPFSAHAFGGDGCDQPCADCHKLSTDDAKDLLGGMVDQVLGVRLGEVPGLFAVDVEKQGKKIPIYIDFSKHYLITGDVFDLRTRQSLTKERFIDLNRVDPSIIPLDDAVVIGDPNAKTKIIVFDDPECPYCVRLHPEMKKAVEMRKDLAFFIKMYPLKIHPNARRKAQAIVCAKSAQMLEDSLAGKPVPEPSCETDQIEKNEALAEQLGVRSTPTLIFPDGRVVPGYKTAEQILAYLDADGKAGGKKP